ncbi:MAG: hypothetical protein RSB75_04315 [Anaerovoracaceae bacterium]
MLTNAAIEGFKKFIESNIAYAKVVIGGKTEKLEINRKERLKDGKIAIYISITPEASSAVTLTKVQLYDNNNDLWAEKNENIPIKAVQEGLLYRFKFDFKEMEG